MRAPWLVLLAVTPAFARHGEVSTLDDQWDDAIDRAGPALAACSKLARTRHVFGDVEVTFDTEHHRWSTSTSKSLFDAADELARCVRGAIEHQAHLDGRGADDNVLHHHQAVGQIIVVLPPPGAVLPTWQRAVAGDAAARRELAHLLPPDSRLTPDGCIQTDAPSLREAQDRWRDSIGPWVPRMWQAALSAGLGHAVHDAVWNGSALVTDGSRGMCLESLDDGRRASLRARFDASASCLAGSFDDVLLHPRAEFPADRSYVDVAVHDHRACAVTATGEIVCCGPSDRALAPPPVAITAIALGSAFACGLDRGRELRCWGDIATPPTGTFTRLSAADDHACAVRTTGQLACWGKRAGTPPTGAFVDVAAAPDGGCAIRGNGSAACWGGKDPPPEPPGAFTAITGGGLRACAIRRDGTVGCWSGTRGPVDTPVPDVVDQVATGVLQGCARRAGDHVATCWGIRPPGTTAAPRDPLLRLAGEHDMFCAIRSAGGIGCWGEVWPMSWLTGSTRGVLPRPKPAPAPGVLAGRIVDDRGAPIAGAEVLVCAGAHGCEPVTWRGRSTPGTIAALMAGVPKTWSRASVVYATTGADGRWRAAMPRDADWLDVVATAPGRELAERYIGRDQREALADDLLLRPATSLDVDAWCDGSPCPGKVLVTRERFNNTGPHLERLTPGTYTIVVKANPGEPGEMQATVPIDVSFQPTPQRVRVDLHKTGTGFSITGRALDCGEPCSIELACGPEGDPEYRHVRADASGRFELHDVPPPPCVVHAIGYEPPGYDGVPERHPSGRVKVDRLPASIEIRVRGE